MHIFIPFFCRSEARSHIQYLLVQVILIASQLIMVVVVGGGFQYPKLLFMLCSCTLKKPQKVPQLRNNQIHGTFYAFQVVLNQIISLNLCLFHYSTVSLMIYNFDFWVKLVGYSVEITRTPHSLRLLQAYMLDRVAQLRLAHAYLDALSEFGLLYQHIYLIGIC